MGNAYDPSASYAVDAVVNAFVEGDSNELHTMPGGKNPSIMVAWRIDGDVYMMLGDLPVIGKYWLNHLLAAMGRSQRFQGVIPAFGIPAGRSTSRFTFDQREVGTDEVIPMPLKAKLTGIRHVYHAITDGVTGTDHE